MSGLGERVDGSGDSESGDTAGVKQGGNAAGVRQAGDKAGTREGGDTAGAKEGGDAFGGNTEGLEVLGRTARDAAVRRGVEGAESGNGTDSDGPASCPPEGHIAGVTDGAGEWISGGEADRRERVRLVGTLEDRAEDAPWEVAIRATVWTIAPRTPPPPRAGSTASSLPPLPLPRARPARAFGN